MKPLVKLTILNLAVIISFTGCKKEKSDNPQSSLENTNWELSYVQSTVTNAIMNFPAAEPRKIVVTYTGASIISFNGICNVGDGTYSCIPEKGELTINNLITTKIACVNVEWEGYTIQSLNKANRYKITGDNLTVYSKGDYDLYFVKQ